MSQRNIMMIFLICMTAISGAMMAFILKDSSKLQKMFKNEQNWKWEDKWSPSHEVNPSQKEEQKDSVKPDLTPEKKPLPQSQIVAGNYKESLQKAEEYNMPILVFFMADWCGHCKNMKAKTLPDKNVVEMMKNYVVVYVDADNDRETIRKFGVIGLPSFVITNSKEEKLKLQSGYMNPNEFYEWLNNPNFFNENEKSPTSPEKQEGSQKRFRDRSTLQPLNWLK